MEKVRASSHPACEARQKIYVLTPSGLMPGNSFFKEDRCPESLKLTCCFKHTKIASVLISLHPICTFCARPLVNELLYCVSVYDSNSLDNTRIQTLLPCAMGADESGTIKRRVQHRLHHAFRFAVGFSFASDPVQNCISVHAGL